MQSTKIQWTDLSVNPLRARRIDGTHRIPGHFCQKISEGCALCYASLASEIPTIRILPHDTGRGRI